LESYYIYEYDSLNRLETTYFKEDDSPDTIAVKLEEYTMRIYMATVFAIKEDIQTVFE